MNNQASRVYSQAFFELSKETNNLDRHMDDLKEISITLGEFPDIHTLLNNPNVSKEDKKELISSVFNYVDNKTLNLIKVLIDKSRFNIFDDFLREYKRQYNLEKNIAEGIVYSANKLDEQELSDLKKVLEKKINKKVELINEIDKSLIAGVSVFIDGKRIDNSIKTRLESLRSSIKERR
ncbi:ATP synthase F1 subunit delta [Helcococcus kunzii]|uniref:ATP synthase F1 subunit delta n=1 Tax=Helcococcus kunzii TaxID=40091 RepID=UPI001C954E17|nr:ATP synthase F1 subunit delta [Helcococcus kunzii]QZO75884.1 ATP synthase F1 subunit delta [Helcococcus kunzii]